MNRDRKSLKSRVQLGLKGLSRLGKVIAKRTGGMGGGVETGSRKASGGRRR